MASRSYHLLLRADRGLDQIQKEIVLGVESLPHVAETDTEGGAFFCRRSRIDTYLWFRSQGPRRLENGAPALLALLDGKGLQDPSPHLFGLRGLKGIDTGRQGLNVILGIVCIGTDFLQKGAVVDKGNAEPCQVKEYGLQGYEPLVRDDENVIVEPIRDGFSGLIGDVGTLDVGVDIVPKEPLLLESAVKDADVLCKGIPVCS